MKLYFNIPNTPFTGKVAPHKEDPALLVLKTKHPEVAPVLATATGVEPVSSFEGSHYFITVFKKEDLVQNFGKMLNEVFEGNISLGFQDEQSGPVVPVLGFEDDEDGDDDGCWS